MPLSKQEEKKRLQKLEELGYQVPELAKPEELQKGDYVITAEIMQVVDPNWRSSGKIEVAPILPGWSDREMGLGPTFIKNYGFGQHGLFMLPRKKKKVSGIEEAIEKASEEVSAAEQWR